MAQGVFRVKWTWPAAGDTVYVDTLALDSIHDASAAHEALKKVPEWQRKKIIQIETVGVR